MTLHSHENRGNLGSVVIHSPLSIQGLFDRPYRQRGGGGGDGNHPRQISSAHGGIVPTNVFSN